MIPVTKSFLPPLSDYSEKLEKIWKSQWVTNRGELVLELEKKIRNDFDTVNLIITNNGTVPLQIALKILGGGGEVITTPFSYIATSAAIVWESCKPVFVDIDPRYLTIDETKIEQAITPKTTMILATHVFGNPCNVEAIDRIAKKYNLKVVYDAAHCFGVTYKGKSIFNYGDISTCSFHATKIFHTGEGGAMFCSDNELFHKLFYSHNFGHNGQLEFFGLGINGKISELQAAMGLTVLPHFDEILAARQKIIGVYNTELSTAKLEKIHLREDTQWNSSYYPVIFETEEALLSAQKQLNDEQIYPRRYFFPSINTVPYIKSEKMPVSESVSGRILCLPLYVGLEEESVRKIAKIILNAC